MAVYNTIFGLEVFYSNISYGIEAFLLTIILYSVAYFWFEMICIAIISTTTIILLFYKENNKETDALNK